MKKRGFTLVELLAVIIILAVVALIATPIILNVVEDAKKSAAESEGRMILTGVKSYCETSKMKAEMQEDYEYECKKGEEESADEFKEKIATIAGIASDKISVETDTTTGEISTIVVDQDSYESIIYMTNSSVETNKKGEEVATFEFTFMNNTCTLNEGATWQDFIDSDECNPDGYFKAAKENNDDRVQYVDGNYVCSLLYEDFVKPTDLIDPEDEFDFWA